MNFKSSSITDRNFYNNTFYSGRWVCKMKILILGLLVSLNVNAKNYFNISYLPEFPFPPSYTAPENFDLEFRSKLINYNERFEISYEFCQSGCYSIGAAYSLQNNILSKYAKTNLTSYLSFNTQAKFYYVTTKYSKFLSESSEAGVFVNIGQESIAISPNEGKATESKVDSYLRYEFGAFMRFGLSLMPTLKMQRLYFESGVNVSLKNNSDVVLNGEKIAAGNLEKQRILLILGLGLSF
jgi:hypothetical protein